MINISALAAAAAHYDAVARAAASISSRSTATAAFSG